MINISDNSGYHRRSFIRRLIWRLWSTDDKHYCQGNWNEVTARSVVRWWVPLLAGSQQQKLSPEVSQSLGSSSVMVDCTNVVRLKYSSITEMYTTSDECTPGLKEKFYFSSVVSVAKVFFYNKIIILRFYEYFRSYVSLLSVIHNSRNFKIIFIHHYSQSLSIYIDFHNPSWHNYFSSYCY